MNEITMKATPGAKARQSWQRGARGWTCVLRCEGRQLTVPFFMGPGLGTREPTLDEVMEALLSDALMVEQAGTPERWAYECGFQPDDVWEPVYRAVSRQTEGLRRLLGSEYEARLYNTNNTQE